MKIIGVTGPTGAGKGELCGCLARRSIPNINADNVYHQLLTPPSPCLDALVRHFGPGILKEDGTLNRRILSAIVFAPGAEAEHDVLNRITHGFVREKLTELIGECSSASCNAVVVDVPLLFESGFDDMCDITVAVLANRAIRTERIMKRDSIDYSAASARVAAQPADEFYLSHADIVIYNNIDSAVLESEAEKILLYLGEQ